jgi:apolipoprotein N-acyltransferase
MDASSAALLTFGVAALAISWILLMVASWKEDYSWGLCTLFLPPLSYLYSLARLDKAGDAILIAIIGWVLIWFGVG